MYRVLIADKNEEIRQQLRDYLEQMSSEYRIYEAPDPKTTHELLHTKRIDILLLGLHTEVQETIELVRVARSEFEYLEIAIVASHSDHGYAAGAEKYGVKEYVWLPVSKEVFVSWMEGMESRLDENKNKRKESHAETDSLQNYYLLQYLYNNSEKILDEAAEEFDLEDWERWRCAILIETDKRFFDIIEDNLEDKLQKELHRTFYYLNLNTRQSLLLFQDSYCDYMLIANNIYLYLMREYKVKLHLALSRRFHSFRSLPGILVELERQMEEKYYFPDARVFASDEDDIRSVSREAQDSQILERISEDIGRKDIEQLWKHFNILVEKYQARHHFSAMYMKFVFSNVIQELYSEPEFSDNDRLAKEIDRLYRCEKMNDIIDVSRDNVRRYERFIKSSMEKSKEKVAAVKEYIETHYNEEMDLRKLSKKVHSYPGYLSFLFYKETGFSVNRFQRVCRMEKARELLRTTDKSTAEIASETGFWREEYFITQYREHYGVCPKDERKKTAQPE